MTTHCNAISVFLSYAHEDEPLLRQLEIHLSLLKRQGLISVWHDRQIDPGANWAQVIDQQLEQASIILLLVSAHFLASDYCYGIEMQRALERHEADQVRVIPLFLRPVDWEHAPFASLQGLPNDGKAVTEWDNQDLAFRTIAHGLRQMIENMSLQPAGAPRAALPAIWNVPYPPNLLFTGRDDVLAQLVSMLHTGQPHAISGLGGIGKTQIAIEYAYRHRQEYQAVLWTLADTRESLVSGYVTIARQLKLLPREVQDQMLVINAVLQWFKTHTQWLLILDNADDLALVREFLPVATGGHVLLTTRAHTMGRLARRVEMETMNLDVGALFLLRRAGVIAQDAELSAATSSDITVASEITEALGGLPLALDQAGAYVEETQCGLSAYQQRYRIRRAMLLKRRGALVTDHPESVALPSH